MDKKVLEFLYKFYKDGDYTSHHSLKDVFDDLPNKWDNQNSIKDIWNCITRLKDRKLIELDHNDFDKWGRIKEGETFDYVKNQVMAVLTENGAKRVRLERVDASVIKTNTATFNNIILTVIFTSIVIFLQIKLDKRETKRTEREIKQERQEQLNHARQEDRDRLIQNSLDSIRQAILDISRNDSPR